MVVIKFQLTLLVMIILAPALNISSSSFQTSKVQVPLSNQFSRLRAGSLAVETGLKLGTSSELDLELPLWKRAFGYECYCPQPGACIVVYNQVLELSITLKQLQSALKYQVLKYWLSSATRYLNFSLHSGTSTVFHTQLPELQFTVSTRVVVHAQESELQSSTRYLNCSPYSGTRAVSYTQEPMLLCTLAFKCCSLCYSTRAVVPSQE